MRYNRGDIGSTVRAAIKSSQKRSQPLYVVPTALGYTITTQPATFTGYIAIQPDGTTQSHAYKTGCPD